MNLDPKRVQKIFADALEKNPGPARAAYLTQTCGDDANLKKRVEVLLTAYGDAGDFLEQPAPALIENSSVSATAVVSVAEPRTAASPAVPASIPAAPPQMRARTNWRRWGMATAIVVILIVLILGTWLTTPFPNIRSGIVRIEVNDPAIQVILAKDRMSIRSDDKQSTIQVVPGEYHLTVQRKDVTLDAAKLVVRGGNMVTLKVDFVDGALRIHRNGQVIEKRIPGK